MESSYSGSGSKQNNASKCQWPLTHWHSITFKKTWTLIYTGIWTWSFATI